MNREISLGSLFDGIGAVPLAASFFGIKTLWASEILPNAVSVTRRHFPDMEHLGDVTKLHGGEIPPVNIVAFGSPCQSFSVAGNRTSFEGKSGLFFEAIRIIREMRAATNGKYPEIVIFENVPGLLSVDSRRSYRTVLEAFTETEIPMPRSGRWADAGMVRGRGIDLAWIIKDAQYYRTAQRRKRLFLVADFTGRRAGEILFISQGLSGYFASREREGKGIAAHAESGVGGAGGGITPAGGHDMEATNRIAKQDGASAGFNGFRSVTGSIEYTEEGAPCLCASMPANVAVFMAGQAKNARSIAYSETVSPTLKGSPSGLNQMPCICEPQAFTMRLREGDIASTQTARQYKDATDLICGRQPEPIPIHDKATRYKGGGPTRKNDGAGNGLGIGKSGGPIPTMTAGDRHIVAAVDCRNLNESGTLQSKSTGGYSLNYQNPVRKGYVIRRLTPTEAERLMSLPDGWTEYGHDGKPMSDSARYSMCGNSIVVNVLAYIMQNISDALSRADGDSPGEAKEGGA